MAIVTCCLVIGIAAMSMREHETIIPSIQSYKYTCTVIVLPIIMEPEYTNDNEVNTFIFNTAAVSRRQIKYHQFSYIVLTKLKYTDVKNTNVKSHLIHPISI